MSVVRFVFQVRTVNGHSLIPNGGVRTFIDCGACRGAFSKELIRSEPWEHAVLVEPSPEGMSYLSDVYSDDEKVTLLHAVVGAESKDAVTFYLSKNPERHSLMKSFCELGQVLQEENYTITVPMIRVQDILSMDGVDTIDVLKVDIEGGEWDVLAGFTEKDFGRISQVSVEFHDFFDTSFVAHTEKCIRTLKNLGYTFVRRKEKYMPGVMYYNCLFFNKKRLKWFNAFKWLPPRVAQYIFSRIS